LTVTADDYGMGVAQPMNIEMNLATIERDTDGYRVVVTVERKGYEAITQEEAEIVLTRVLPLLVTQRIRIGGPSHAG